MNSSQSVKREIMVGLDYNLGYWIKDFYSNQKKNRREQELSGMRIITIVECMKTIDFSIPWASSMYDALYPEVFL